MTKIKTEPNIKDLRTFSFLVGGILAAIFGGLIPYINRGSWNPYLVYIGTSIIALGIIYPKILRYPYKLWMLLGEVLGWINTRIILSVIFFFLFTPIGFLKRIFGKDSMRRKLEPQADSYRIICPERVANHMERPF